MNLWVAEGGIKVACSPNLRTLFKGSGNLMQRLALKLAPDLMDAITLTQWRQKDLRWIVLEGGVEHAWQSDFPFLMRCDGIISGWL